MPESERELYTQEEIREIETGSNSKTVVEALRKLVPESEQNKVKLVDLDSLNTLN